MRCYIDASAAAKLVVAESESTALRQFLAGLTDDDELVSSLLVETELRRIAVRESLPQLDITNLLRGINLVHPEPDFFHAAGLLPGRFLRALDALHLMTAIMSEAQTFIAYDRRLVAAAVETGFQIASPS